MSSKATKAGNGKSGQATSAMDLYLMRDQSRVRLYARRPSSIPPAVHPGEVMVSLQPVVKGQVQAWAPLWERWVKIDHLPLELQALQAEGWTVSGRQRLDMKAFGMLGAAEAHGISMDAKSSLDTETLALVVEAETLKPSSAQPPLKLKRQGAASPVEPLRPMPKRSSKPASKPVLHLSYEDAWRIEEVRRKRASELLKRQQARFSDLSPADQERVRQSLAAERARQLAFDLQWGTRQAAG